MININVKKVLIGTAILLINSFSLINKATAQTLTTGDCSNKAFIEKVAHLIVIGKVNHVNSSWDAKGSKAIYTYIGLDVGKYIKGGSVKNDRLTIVTRGGCVGSFCENEPNRPELREDMIVKVYLNKNIHLNLCSKKAKEEYSIVCDKAGVEKLSPAEWERIEYEKLGPMGRLERAMDQGRISQKERFILTMRLWYAPDTIPPSSEFAVKLGERVERDPYCGTGESQWEWEELHQLYPQFTTEDKKLLKKLNPVLKSRLETIEEEQKKRIKREHA